MTDGQHRTPPPLIHAMLANVLDGLDHAASDAGFTGDAYVPVTFKVNRAMYEILREELEQTKPEVDRG